MRILYIGGNIGPGSPPHTTENAYMDAFAALGHEVLPLRQDALSPDEPLSSANSRAVEAACPAPPDLVVYTRTHNRTALGPAWTEAWRALEANGTATIGLHLDVFVGLPEREAWITGGDPLFTAGTVFTPDGSDRAAQFFGEHGVNHRWLPPACDTRHIPNICSGYAELDGKIVFVGSSAGYHAAWPHRAQLIDFLARHYRDRFVPLGNGTSWGPRRDPDLARVYASDCIVVGDHCFADERPYYWSDRVPETLGRGGLLVHPLSPGIRDWYGRDEVLYYRPYDWASLEGMIAWCDSLTFAEREGRRNEGLRRVRYGAARDFDRSGPQIDAMPTEWRAQPDTYAERAAQILAVLGLA